MRYVFEVRLRRLKMRMPLGVFSPKLRSSPSDGRFFVGE